MKIIDVETFQISQRQVLLKISTDEGVSGWGEPTLEGWAPTVTSAVDQISTHLLGQDPLEITRLWQILTRGGFYRGGAVLASAVSGLDQALWDIKGRWHGAPIHELLGGPTRDRARVYAHSNRLGHTGDPALAASLVHAGFTMIKVAPEVPVDYLARPNFLEEMLAELAAVRASVGSGIDIAIDLHGRFSLPMSKRLLPRLDDLNIAFVEEPTRPEHSHLLHELVRISTTPIATGERLYSRAEFRTVLDAGVSIVQPDPSHAGGITEGFRIACQAEVYDAQVAPHCPLGPVALAASLQLDFAIPNFYAQEQGFNTSYGHTDDPTILRNPEVLVAEKGYIPRLVGPGLGIEIDEDVVRSKTRQLELAGGTPRWSNVDGSYAEW